MRLIWLWLLFISSTVSAQKITVKGKTVDDIGQPLPGVSIRLKGTDAGTVSGENGNFWLTVAKLPVILQFSYVGYAGKEYKVSEVDSTKEITLVLSRIKAELSEVVVVGYSGARRSAALDFTSSASLSGKVSGVRVRGYSTSHFKTETRGLSSEKRGEDKLSSLKKTSPFLEGKAKLLTAGELSDFKKWKLWNDYNADEFRQWSRHWGLTTKVRYCVQVQNEEHQAMAGQKVYLLNQAKDTVWQTVTDNTGKAELWASFYDTTQTNKSLYTLVCGQTVIWSPTEFANGINRVVVKKACNTPNVVDIAFVVDATGSMGDEIQYLQAELKDVTEKVRRRFSDVQFRWGSVFYKDESDNYLTRHLPLQSEANSLFEFINQQSAGGGGDLPEAVDAALQTAIDSLGWSKEARSRILFLVLDAPPHDEAKDRMHSLIKQAAKQGIRIVPIVGSGIDKSTEYLMRCVALATNGSYVFLTDHSGIGGKHIKPTIDEFKVELLNDLLQRLIGEMIFLPACNTSEPLVQRHNVDSANQVVKVQLFPNPTSGRVTLRASQTLAEVYVTDFAGKILYRLNNQSSNQYTTDLSNYPSGTYLLKYFVKDKGWGTEKILLVH